MRNQHLVVEGFACYYVIEPGDGTRYTAFYVTDPDNDPDNIYVGFGPGQHLTGGYFLRRSSLKRLGSRLFAVAAEDDSMLRVLQRDHYIGYWTPHFKANADNHNVDWTTIAAILFGLAMSASPAGEDTDLSLKFIGDVYNNRTVEVVTTLAMWGINSDQVETSRE